MGIESKAFNLIITDNTGIFKKIWQIYWSESILKL